MGVHDAIWNQTEESYLATATEEQKEDYSRMTRKEKGAALIKFVSAQPSPPGTKPWRKMLIAGLSAMAARED